MKYFKRTTRFFRIVLFAFMFSVCMVLGIVPIIPKRREQIEIEIKADGIEEENTNSEKNILYKAD